MTDLSGLDTTPEVGDDSLEFMVPPALIADFVDVLISWARGCGRRRGPSAFSASLRFASSRSAARTRCRRW